MTTLVDARPKGLPGEGLKGERKEMLCCVEDDKESCQSAAKGVAHASRAIRLAGFMLAALHL